MNPYRIASLMMLTFLNGCGGISDDTLIADLTVDDAATVCEEFAEYDRSVTCGTGDTAVTIDMGMGTVEECTAEFEPAPAGCTATMGDVRACMDAFNALTDEDICAGTTGIPPECTAMMSESCG